MQSGKQTTPEPPKGKLSTTCTACRSRHLRCDGPPACTRCRANGVACVFVESRRGKRTPGPQRATDFSPQTLSPSIGRVGEMSPITARQSGSWTIPQQMPNLFGMSSSLVLLPNYDLFDAMARNPSRPAILLRNI